MTKDLCVIPDCPHWRIEGSDYCMSHDVAFHQATGASVAEQASGQSRVAPLPAEAPSSNERLLRDARDFVGKSRCSVGHSVSEVADRAKPGMRHCLYCAAQFELYQRLLAAERLPDETTALSIAVRELLASECSVPAPMCGHANDPVNDLRLVSGRRLEKVRAALGSPVETSGLPHLDTCKLKYGGSKCTCGLEEPENGIGASY